MKITSPTCKRRVRHNTCSTASKNPWRFQGFCQCLLEKWSLYISGQAARNDPGNGHQTTPDGYDIAQLTGDMKSPSASLTVPANSQNKNHSAELNRRGGAPRKEARNKEFSSSLRSSLAKQIKPLVKCLTW